MQRHVTFRAYAGQVWKRAFTLDWISYVLSAISVSTTISLLAYAFGRDRAMEEVRTTAISAISAAVAGFIGLMIQFFRAAHVMHQEDAELLAAAGQRCETLAAEAGQRRRKQQLADELTEWLREGIHDILNDPIDGNDRPSVDMFHMKANHWTSEVKRVMERGGCTKQEVSLFWDLHAGDIPQAADAGYFHGNVAFARAKAMFQKRIDNLRAVINNYTDVPVWRQGV